MPDPEEEIDERPPARAGLSRLFLDTVIPDESELTCGTKIEPGKGYGFFTDTTRLHRLQGLRGRLQGVEQPAGRQYGLTGHSYDNTGDLRANTWRHVTFIEKIGRRRGPRDRMRRSRATG